MVFEKRGNEHRLKRYPTFILDKESEHFGKAALTYSICSGGDVPRDFAKYSMMLIGSGKDIEIIDWGYFSGKLPERFREFSTYEDLNNFLEDFYNKEFDVRPFHQDNSRD